MEQSPDQTIDLLRRWHGGDQDALERLVIQELPWIESQVRRRLGPMLRGKAETHDFVQDAMIDVLRYGPRFVTSSRARFRALVARIIENNLRDKHDWHSAKRRASDREVAMPSQSVLDLDSGAALSTTPSRLAMQQEHEAWLRLALELLEPDDRRVILLREWRGLGFDEVGEQLGVSGEAARKRFHRALPKLVRKIEELKQGGATRGAPEA